MILHKNVKPVKIWIVQAWNEESGELFEERAFRYKCEAERYLRYMQHQENLNGEIHEDMLY